MFDFGSSELLLIVIVAVIVIGPKDLPRALYKVGQIVGKARGMARHFRSGIDAMVREVELEELEKKWAAQNQRILQDHPNTDLPVEAAPDQLALSTTPMEPLPAAPPASDAPKSVAPDVEPGAEPNRAADGADSARNGGAA